jgi:transposase
MANVTKMDVINSIRVLYKKGWSQRRIAETLEINRRTVSRYIRESADEAQSAPNPTAGNGGGLESKRTKPDRRLSGPPSQCEPHRSRIEDAVEEGLSAQRIYQDLCAELDYEGSYESVKRFVARLRRKDPKRFERVEVPPGAEAQVDFGSGYWIKKPDGKSRKAHILRVVLSHSRKGYTEMVFTQDTETFVRCLENAFRHFGGVPQTLVIDNLKAAIPKADWYEPEVHPKLRDFAEYYGVAILPTKPYHPHHKGKVERGVAYVKDNALQGRKFATPAEANTFLSEWESQIADTRIHGTTRKQVGSHFRETELPALQALPDMHFPAFSEGERMVHRDGYVEVKRSYYQAPPEYVGRKVWVRWDSRTVRIFNHRMREVRVHGRVEEGQFAAKPGDENPYESKRSCAHLFKRIDPMGPFCGQWAREQVHRRGAEAYRTLLGLLDLTRKHDAEQIDHACEQALGYGMNHLKDLQQLIAYPRDAQQELEFLREHPLIRGLDDYQTHLNQPQPKESPC